MDNNTTACTNVVRDPSYYMDAGDCIIRVEGTLFKVHKAFLSRDASVFEGMFTLPQNPDEDSEVEGVSDQQPITLFGDTVEQFRALLWILYALPHQIEKLMLEKVPRLPELLTIAEITNKYHFVELGIWAVKLLKAVFHETTVSPIYHERLLRLATLSSDRLLCEYLVSTLAERLMDGTLAPTETLMVADRLQIRDLQGAAYYAQLLALQKNTSDHIAFPANCPLAKDQRIRLVTGYWSLMRSWERLQDSPVAIEQSPSCPTQLHNTGCRPVWIAEWRKHAHAQTIAQHASADVLGKIQVMLTLLQESFPKKNVHPGLQHPSQQNVGTQNNIQHMIQQQNTHGMHHNALQQLFQAQINLQQQIPIPPQQNIHFPNNFTQQNIPGPIIPLPPGIHGGNNVQQNIGGMQRASLLAVYTTTGFPLCTQMALAKTKKLADDIRTSLLDFFSEDALGLTQASS